MSTIILVRHGENDWSKKNKLAGWISGVHLNEEGHRQAQAAAKRLAPLPVKAVYSSPVTRCMETAAYIAETLHLGVVQLDEVGEVVYGQWEGKKIRKLAKKPLWWAVQHAPSRARFPDGEALREVQFRAVQALETLGAKHEKDVVVVVTHADVIRLVLAHYLGVHIDLFQRIIISPASASIIHLSPGGMVRVVRMNDDGPLRPPPQPEPAKKSKKGKKGKGKKGKKDGKDEKRKEASGKSGKKKTKRSKAAVAAGAHGAVVDSAVFDGEEE